MAKHTCDLKARPVGSEEPRAVLCTPQSLARHAAAPRPRRPHHCSRRCRSGNQDVRSSEAYRSLTSDSLQTARALPRKGPVGKQASSGQVDYRERGIASGLTGATCLRAVTRCLPIWYNCFAWSDAATFRETPTRRAGRGSAKRSVRQWQAILHRCVCVSVARESGGFGILRIFESIECSFGKKEETKSDECAASVLGHGLVHRNA